MRAIKMNAPAKFFYTNHRGERELRNVEVLDLGYGEVAGYYPEPTWLLHCRDLDRMAYRSFALDKIEMDTWEQ